MHILWIYVSRQNATPLVYVVYSRSLPGKVKSYKTDFAAHPAWHPVSNENLSARVNRPECEACHPRPSQSDYLVYVGLYILYTYVLVRYAT